MEPPPPVNPVKKRLMGPLSRRNSTIGLTRPMMTDWSTKEPCYEIINIVFQDDNSTSSSDEEADVNESCDLGDILNSSNLELQGDREIVIDADDMDRDVKPTISTEISWTCPCKEKNGSFEELVEHWMTKHGTDKFCKFCPDKTTKANNMKHLLSEHVKRWACLECKIGFPDLPAYSSHVDSEHPNQDYAVIGNYTGNLTCVFCDVWFKSVRKFNDHVLNVETRNICCSYRFQQQERLLNHFYHKHLSCQFTCAEYNCKVSFRTPFMLVEHCFQAHAFVAEAEPSKFKFLCDICGKYFASKTTAFRHRRRHFERKTDNATKETTVPREEEEEGRNERVEDTSKRQKMDTVSRKVKTPTKGHKCELCQRYFAHSDYQRHLKAEHPVMD